MSRYTVFIKEQAQQDLKALSKCSQGVCPPVHIKLSVTFLLASDGANQSL